MEEGGIRKVEGGSRKVEGGSRQHSCGKKEEGRKYIIPQTFITRQQAIISSFVIQPSSIKLLHPS